MEQGGIVEVIGPAGPVFVQRASLEAHLQQGYKLAHGATPPPLPPAASWGASATAGGVHVSDDDDEE